MKQHSLPFGAATIRYFLCGILIGGGSILPGVSGGVLAVVLGLYRPLMSFLSSPRAALRAHWQMLPPLGLGLGIGFILFAKLIALAMGASSMVTTCAFIGLIVGTLPSLERESRKEGRNIWCFVSFALCAAIVWASLYALKDASLDVENPSYALYALCGILLGLGTVVPGLSASSVLMALGMYAPMMEATGSLDFAVLIQFVPWTAVAVLALARFTTWVFDHYYAVAFHGIMGIVISSTILIIPTGYESVGQLILGLISAAVGCAVALTMVKLDPA